MTKIRNEANPDHWSDIVGMPDKWDLENLTKLINNFKKEKFTYNDETFTGAQWIKREVADAKKQHNTEGLGGALNPYGEKVKSSETRIGSAIPNTLWARIQESYPTMFRDRKHFSWFIKNFPEFKVARKF